MLPLIDSISVHENHEAAARRLLDKFAEEDQKTYGSSLREHHWLRRSILVSGDLPQKEKASRVFVMCLDPKGKGEVRP